MRRSLGMEGTSEWEPPVLCLMRFALLVGVAGNPVSFRRVVVCRLKFVEGALQEPFVKLPVDHVVLDEADEFVENFMLEFDFDHCSISEKAASTKR